MSLTDGFWIAAAGLAALFFFSRLRGRINGAQAHALVAGGAGLIDVRSRAEFEAGHLEGARNFPVDELERRSTELGAKEAALVLYCASGMRSASAASALKRRGFTQVHNLGAMQRWG